MYYGNNTQFIILYGQRYFFLFIIVETNVIILSGQRYFFFLLNHSISPS